MAKSAGSGQTRCSGLGTPNLAPQSMCPEPGCHTLLLFQWGLVCARQNLKPMGQAIFMAGILLGFAVWGLLSYW